MKKEFLFATVLYVVTIVTLLGVVYSFLAAWQLGGVNFFVIVGVAIVVLLGWGFVLLTLFEPKEALEQKFTTMTKEVLHELNIPLSTIQANTQLLQREATDEKSQKRLERIEEATYRLKRLYEEFAYTIRKETQVIVKEQCNLQQLITQRVKHFEMLHRQTFHLTIPPYEVLIDKIGFEKMIDNLITNAMKYSPKESALTLHLKGDTLCIKDQGIGIEQTELVKIFERYYQSNQNQEGQGIGLALVKAYCDSEHIGIEIDSIPHKGTEVRLLLAKIKC
jgi:signal transduction histidine kinase